jgi:uncharacterized membrane protein (Fun14 family)
MPGLAYAGYITIDYKKVQKSAETLIDADKDGKITAHDFVVMWRSLKSVLVSQLPQASGFSAGFAMGIYYA